MDFRYQKIIEAEKRVRCNVKRCLLIVVLLQSQRRDRLDRAHVNHLAKQMDVSERHLMRPTVSIHIAVPHLDLGRTKYFRNHVGCSKEYDSDRPRSRQANLDIELSELYTSTIEKPAAPATGGS